MKNDMAMTSTLFDIVLMGWEIVMTVNSSRKNRTPFDEMKHNLTYYIFSYISNCTKKILILFVRKVI